MSRSAPNPSLYDHIGIDYDVTRRADPYLVARLIHHLDGEPIGAYLDLACGTGSYTAAMAQTGLRVHGLDQS
jgi:protein-L-isoaspartate O-methyltransferase